MKELEDYVPELSGISSNITLIRTQFQDNQRTLTDEAMDNLLFSLQEHLDRIIDEMQK